MLVSISIVRYSLLFIPLAVLAMAIPRIPLSLNKACTFWKLMGCGKNGSFDLEPDVEPVAEIMTKAPGFITSVGRGTNKGIYPIKEIQQYLTKTM